MSNFTNFIHLDAFPVAGTQLDNYLHNLGFIYWENLLNDAMTEPIINQEGLETLVFIKNMSIYNRQINGTLKILFGESYEDGVLRTKIKDFILSDYSILDFQNVIILGFMLVEPNNRQDQLITIDMTITNSVIENERAIRGEVPAWEGLFGITLPLIPDLIGIHSLEPEKIEEENYTGLVASISELTDNTIEGAITDSTAGELLPDDLTGISNSIINVIVLDNDDYPQSQFGLDAVSGTFSDWELYNFWNGDE